MYRGGMKSLKLKWMNQDMYEVENLYTFEVENELEALELFYEGVRNKKMASHKLNNASSRSHTIFNINIDRINVNDPDDIVKSKLLYLLYAKLSLLYQIKQ